MIELSNCLLKVLRLEFREFCVSLTLRQIKNIFSTAGFILDNADSYGARRDLIDAFYDSTDWTSEKAAQNFLKVIEYTFQLHYLTDKDKEYLASLCIENGFLVRDNKLFYKDIFPIVDLFSYQFPAGLPFGIKKPNFSITAERGIQVLKYEIQTGGRLLNGKIYPNLSFRTLEDLFEISSSAKNDFKRELVRMNQSEYEKSFFLAYAKRFEMAKKDLPVLIPQAWIQWHSQSKANLRSTSAKHKDDLYRVDFVAFWRNKRYAILVDDISHYAERADENSDWKAHEESYSKRLKEDRKLRKETWQVFRVSNWELRQPRRIDETLNDLQEFIGF